MSIICDYNKIIYHKFKKIESKINKIKSTLVIISIP